MIAHKELFIIIFFFFGESNPGDIEDISTMLLFLCLCVIGKVSSETLSEKLR